MGITQLILPVLLIAGGLVLGLASERFIRTKLKAVASRTKWEGYQIVISSIRGMTIIWLTTVGIYAALLSLQVGPEVLDFLRKPLLVIVIGSGTIVLARITVGFVGMYANRVLPTTSSIFTSITNFVVFTIGALILMQTLGISITPLLTALGVGGLAVALALQDTLSNLFAGIHIIASKQVRPGEYVKLSSGEEGYVTDITWRNTTIRALPNNMIIIPNSKLASTIVTNYYHPATEMAVLVQVRVSYDSDLEKVERVTIAVGKEVLTEVAGGVPEFEPFIRYHTFGDHGIHFSVILRGREFTDQYLITHEFIKRLHRRYRQEGIQIPYPIRTIHVHNGRGEDSQLPEPLFSNVK